MRWSEPVRAALLAAALAAPLHATAGDDPALALRSARAAAVDAPVPGPSVDDRLGEIARRIQAALEYPPLARRRGTEGEALVAFRVAADLRAADVEVARSSGHPELDRAAARAVVAAGRLPYVLGRLEIPVRFELDRGGME